MSLYQDLSSRNTQIHVCTVERVYHSGLIDARSDRDLFFEQINSVFFGAEGNYSVGSRCLVISDGAQHFSFGQIRDPKSNADGTISVKNIENDLADMTNAKALVATDDFGSQAKVVAAPGAGVVLDSGENAMAHFDPGNNRITFIADRQEVVTVPYTMDADHDGVKASTSYKWRTVSDSLSWDRDMARERNDALDLGGIITAEIGPSPDVVRIDYKTGVESLATIEISSGGGITMENKNAKIEMGELGDVKVNAGVGQISITPTGHFKIGTDAVDLLDLLSQTLTMLSTATTATIFGQSPITQGFAFGTLATGPLNSING